MLKRKENQQRKEKDRKGQKRRENEGEMSYRSG